MWPPWTCRRWCPPAGCFSMAASAGPSKDSSSIPLGWLNWKSQLSAFSESAIKPSMLLAGQYCVVIMASVATATDSP
jgi:hypothetical protein